jgi:hypothetical protein
MLRDLGVKPAYATQRNELDRPWGSGMSTLEPSQSSALGETEVVEVGTNETYPDQGGARPGNGRANVLAFFA